MSDSNKIVRYGLVGYGAWGKHHARVIAAGKDTELKAIAVQSEKSREEARKTYPKCSVYEDYQELLRRPDIDVVDVVLPSHLHHEVGQAVLEADKHLLMEKPMALSIAQCEDLIKLAQKKERLLAIAHEFRFSSLWGKVKEMVDAGIIGDPRYCLIELWRNPYRQGSDGWRYDIKRVGSWILEEPIHFFDLARWYFSKVGEPISICANASHKRDERPELLDNFSAMMRFPNGGYAVVSQTLAGYEHHQMVKLTGTKGALWANWSGALDRTFHPTFWLKHFDGEKVVEIPLEKASGEVFELEEAVNGMTRAVLGEPLQGATGQDGRWSVAMCLKAQESVDTGSVVKF
jgi:myo-inositol 2-dehydrogenase/D-chiro-inositol 1-dehydrogenase